LSCADKLKFVGQHLALSSTKPGGAASVKFKNTNKDREMFRIKASYTGQLELKTTLERKRANFFGDFKNFADLMPGIERHALNAKRARHRSLDRARRGSVIGSVQAILPCARRKIARAA